MAADVFTFLANFRGGGARPNRYEVQLTFPAGVPNAVFAAEKISFTCMATSIPSSQMGVVGNVQYKGRPVKLAGDKTFDDWNVTVLIDNDWLGRSVFESWHDKILGFRSNVATPTMINPVNYFAKAVVNQLDRADRVIQSYEVEGMFPSSVGELALGYDQNDTVMQQTVTFAINGWSSNVTS